MKLANKIVLHDPLAVVTVDCISAVYFMHCTVLKRSKQHILYTLLIMLKCMPIPPFCEASISFSAPITTRSSASVPPPLIRALTFGVYCCVCFILSHPPSAKHPFACNSQFVQLQNPFHKDMVQ